MVTEIRPEQPLKAPPPIEVTESGMVRVVKLVQPRNVPPPIEVTEAGMTTDIRPEQPLKASPPTEVTESGMVIEVSSPLFSAKRSGICSTPSPILRIVSGQSSNQGLR